MLLKPQTRSLLLTLLIVAIVLRLGLVTLLLGLLTLTLGLAALWSRWAFRGVRYERSLSSERAFVGDVVTLTQRVINAKLLGLPNLRIDDRVSDKLRYGDQRLVPHTQTGYYLIQRWTALRAYEAVSWDMAITCPQRGLYMFGPAHMQASDLFGLHTRYLDLADQTHLIVYPQLIDLPLLNLRAQRPIGDTRSPRHVLTDPPRTVGVRDYQRDDPLKAIHWGATARRGELQTRVYEPTVSLDVAIVLNIDTFEHYWEGVRPDLVERMISAAATIATEANEQRLGIGLYTNGALADSGQIARLAPSRSPLQLDLVLQALAKLIPYSVAPFAPFLRRIGPTLEWGVTLVLVNAVASEEIQTALVRLARRGRRIIWLYVGDADTPHLPGVEVVRLPVDTRRWSDRRGADVTSPAM